MTPTQTPRQSLVAQLVDTMETLVTIQTTGDTSNQLPVAALVAIENARDDIKKAILASVETDAATTPLRSIA